MERVFIEQALSVCKLKLDQTAQASVAGDWFIWFPANTNSAVVKSITEWIQLANVHNNRTVLWKNWHFELDNWSSVFCHSFGGTLSCNCLLTKVQDHSALVFIVSHLPSGIIAAQVMEMENETTASFDVECALCGLDQLLTTRKFPNAEFGNYKIAYTTTRIRGYSYLTTKTFLYHSSTHFAQHDLTNEIQRWAKPIDSLLIYKGITSMIRYSVWQHLGSFIPGVPKAAYIDQLLDKKLL